MARRLKGQVSVEWLIILAVVMLLIVGVAYTVLELQKSSQGNVTVGSENKTQVEAVKSGLDALRNATSNVNATS